MKIITENEIVQFEQKGFLIKKNFYNKSKYLTRLIDDQSIKEILYKLFK